MRALVKRYGDVLAVDGVSFDVEPATVCALLGPNGAGKTSIVECIAGFRRPDGGHVRVLGFDPHRLRAPLVERMGVMLQEGGAYQAATPLEMVRLFARFYPRPQDAQALLERVGLAEASGTNFRALSGGQKQRLNLALALVGQPDVLLLDEPTAGMDPQARHATWDLIRELRGQGATVLLTTHAMDEAERLADHVVIVDHGRVLAADSPHALVGAVATRVLVVTSPAAVDAEELSRALSALVEPDGVGRWRVTAGPEAIPAVTRWFDERGLPVTGVQVDGGLEQVFLQLTGRQVRG